MSLDAVVDVGHGRRPNGTYDPGSIGTDGTREHDQAHLVTRVALAALRRSRVSFDSDDHGTGGAHDPNYAGSVKRVNRLDPMCAVEVHFDWNRAPRGGFGIHYPYGSGGGPGRRLAAAIAAAYRRRGLPLRYDGTYSDTRGLAFVRQTDRPAVIWECDRVGAASADELRAYGEAIAEGIATFVGKRYVAPGGTTPTEEDDMTPEDRELLRETHGAVVGDRSGLFAVLSLLRKVRATQLGQGAELDELVDREVADVDVEKLADLLVEEVGDEVARRIGERLVRE